MSSSISLPTFRLPSKAKFWKKRRSEDLGESDPSYRAIYLGNVLTGWAKGKFSYALNLRKKSLIVLISRKNKNQNI